MTNPQPETKGETVMTRELTAAQRFTWETVRHALPAAVTRRLFRDAKAGYPWGVACEHDQQTGIVVLCGLDRKAALRGLERAGMLRITAYRSVTAVSDEVCTLADRGERVIVVGETEAGTGRDDWPRVLVTTPAYQMPLSWPGVTAEEVRQLFQGAGWVVK